MKPLNLQFLPLTFIDSAEKIKEQIINTAVFASLLEEHSRTNLKYYLESTQYGYTASSSEQGDYKFLRITDINHGTVEWSSVPFCSGSDVEKYLLKSNDILVARTGGTTGKSHLVTNPPNNAVFASYLIRLRPEQHTNPLFIDAFLNSYLFWNQVVALKSGSAQPNVNAEKLKELILPKCDLATQNRVVDFIKNPETMGSALRQRVSRVIEKYDTLNGLLSTIDSQLGVIPQLRQALLREAMQGQLLPQDPTDEPAAVLLQQLQAAAKPGKKGRGPAAPLFAEAAEAVEGPFAIPASWVWCRIRDIAKIGTGATPNTSNRDYYEAGNIPWVTSSVTSQDVITSLETFITQKAVDETNCKVYPVGTLVVAMYGQGKTRGQIAELGIAAATNQACAAIQPLIDNEANRQFIKLFFTKIYAEIRELASGGAQPNLNLSKVADTLIPLPPLAEQHRIVAKLALLLQHCDTLEQRIRESRRLAEQLLATALREALAPSTSALLPEVSEQALAEATQAPIRHSSRRGTQLALGTLLD